MAIQVSERRKGVGIFGWLVIVLIIGGLAYVSYSIWFAPGELFDGVVLSQKQEAISTLSDVEFNLEDVRDNTVFRSLKPHVLPVGIGDVGRLNPFLPF